MDALQKYAIPLVLLAATFSLMVYALFVAPASQQAQHTKGIKYSEINKINQESVRQMQIKQNLTDMENRASGSIGDGVRREKELVPNVVNMQPNSGAFDAEDSSKVGTPTLDAKMESFLAEREKFEEMERIKRKEYVEMFLKQAREMGYKVEINSDMEIVKVEKLN